MTDKPGTNLPKHVCTCGECSSAFSAFNDRCVYQEALSIAIQALEKTINYGEALQPGPIHHVTFHACEIAKEALSRIRKLGEEKDGE